MTQRTNARIAGSVFLLYIATGITSMVLFNLATHGAEGTAATLASIARHAPLVRLTSLFTLICGLYAVVLGVTLYALTRDEDRDLALLALCCRLIEGVLGVAAAGRTPQLIAVATASTTAGGPDSAAAQALGGMLLGQGGWGSVGATCFAIGSTLFSYLLLRARSIPVPLAWLGVVSSVLLVIALTVQLAGHLHGPMTYYVWIPMALFEVTFALWLIVKGVAMPPQRQPA
jgi:hypothetical protein